MDKIPITHLGYEALEKELKQLKGTDRPAIIEAIAEARAHGDLSENAEYHAAREKQSFIEGRIAMLEETMAKAEVIHTHTLSGERVMFGARVKVVDEETDEEISYQIVSEYEADLESGLISHVSPIARALIGKEMGDSVEVTAPAGNRYYEILEVAYE